MLDKFLMVDREWRVFGLRNTAAFKSKFAG
jgi:hypothetical protein